MLENKGNEESVSGGDESLEKNISVREGDEEKVEEEQSTSFNTVPIPLVVPFPQRLKPIKLNKDFDKFVKIFKQLHINIPFIDVISQIPSYAKFLKEIMTRKRRLEDHEMIALTEECSVIIQNKLPLNLKDPGSFSTLCTISVILNFLKHYVTLVQVYH